MIMRNRVQLIGHLGATPEVKIFGNDGKVAKATMATNESFRNTKGEYVKETTWHTLTFWGKAAENAEKFLKKGTEVLVEGKIVNGSYDGKDGQKHYFSEVKVEQFVVLNNGVEKG